MNSRQESMRGKKLLAVLIVGAALTMAAGRVRPQVSEPTPTNAHPLWQADLHQFGYVQATSSDQRSLHNKLDFMGNDRLAWAWLTLDNPPTPARKSNKKGSPHPPQPKAAHLHVLFLDARTGEKRALQEWPTPSFPVRFFGVHDGRFLTCNDKVLRTFSSSFEILHEQDFPTADACGNLKISPSRHILYVSYPEGETDRTQLRDIDTFSAVRSWTEQKTNREPYLFSIADHWLVGTCGQPREICIREIDQVWHPFKPVGLDTLMYDPSRASPVFVSDSALAIKAWNEIAVATTEGSVLFQTKLPKNRSFAEPLSSSGSERFAVIENRQRGITNESLDMYAFPANDRVVVYSIPDGRAVYALKVKGTSPWAPWKPHLNEIALSPDGTLLAVESDSALKVFRLSGSNTPQH